MPDEALSALLTVAGAGNASSLVSVELRHLGGALAQGGEGTGALATLDAAYALHTVGVPVTPEVGRRSCSAARGCGPRSRPTAPAART